MKSMEVHTNTELAKTSEVKRRYRIKGLIMFIIGLIIAFVTYMGYQSDYSTRKSERVLVMTFVTSVVFIGAGSWMMVTGTKASLGFKRK